MGKSFDPELVERGQISATFRATLDESSGNPGGVILEQIIRMASRIISERAFEFSCRIVRLCDRLWKRGFKGRKIADQLFDAGTSIGANSEEAEGAQTKPDFIAKLAVAGRRAAKPSTGSAWQSRQMSSRKTRSPGNSTKLPNSAP